MELLKVDKTPAQFSWKDVKFSFRTFVTAQDKFAVDTSGRKIANGQVEFEPWDFYKTMIRLFVVGWANVTEDGKAVPYSFETFLTRFPGDATDDIIMLLGHAIATQNGFLKKAEEAGAEIKNG